LNEEIEHLNSNIRNVLGKIKNDKPLGNQKKFSGNNGNKNAKDEPAPIKKQRKY